MKCLTSGQMVYSQQLLSVHFSPSTVSILATYNGEGGTIKQFSARGRSINHQHNDHANASWQLI